MRMRTWAKLGMVLMVSAVTLGVAGTSRPASAALCCSECAERYQECYDGYGQNNCGGDRACCDATIHCYGFCTFSCLWSGPEESSEAAACPADAASAGGFLFVPPAEAR